MPNWNLSATIAFKSGNWTTIELVKDDNGFRSTGQVSLLALPEFCDLVEKLGLKAHGRFSSKKVKMVVYRFTVQDGKKALALAGGTMGVNGIGDLNLGKNLFRDDDFSNAFPVEVEAGS